MTYKPLLLPNPYVFPAYPPPLPERVGDDIGGPDVVIKAEIAEEHDRGIALNVTLESGAVAMVNLGFVAPGICRVLLEEQPDPERVTLAKDLSKESVFVSIENLEDRVKLSSTELILEVVLDPFHITFFSGEGEVLLDQNYSHRDATGRITMLPFGKSEVGGERAAFHDTFTAEPDEHYYGFGEKFTDFDKRGQRLEMWTHNTYGVHTERAYKNHPFFISTRGYGIFVDSAKCIRFDMAASNHAVFSMIVPDTALDYYVITGSNLEHIITRYSSLTSFPVLPPKWAFGLWMSSGFQADSSEDLLTRAQRLREEDIPCDVLHLDCYWQRHGAWSDMEWDREVFHDPEGMLEQMKEMNFKISAWENPYLGVESEHFEMAVEKGFLLKNTEGEPYVLDTWDGYHPPVGILDFTNPDAAEWFREQHRVLLRMGIDVFKTDFGESVPHDSIASNGWTGEILHNLYPLLYNDIVTQVTAEETGRVGIVWARSSYTGGQRHPIQWGADCDCSYQGLASTIRGGLSLGLCGQPFWGHDIGGFYIEPSPELYIRWTQFGAFSPVSRAHGVTTRLPWDYGEEAMRNFKKYIKLRYRLMPYIFSHACQAVKTSSPMLRPLVLDYPDDPATYGMDLQYMFGSAFLVAPIYNSEGRRPIYLPEGSWVDFWTNEVLQGPQTLWVESPLDVIPVYVRGNSLVPTIKPVKYLVDEPFDFVTIDAYLFDHAALELVDTDGVTQISAGLDGSKLTLSYDGAKSRLGFRLLPIQGVPEIREVIVNGENVQEVDDLELSLQSPTGWRLEADGTVLIAMVN